MKLVITFSTFLFSLSVFADLRVYQYLITNNLESSKKEEKVITTSSLNPTAYIAYHGGSDVIEVDLLRTWMCHGYTAKKPLCPPPLNYIIENGDLP